MAEIPACLETSEFRDGLLKKIAPKASWREAQARLQVAAAAADAVGFDGPLSVKQFMVFTAPNLKVTCIAHVHSTNTV